MTFCDSAHKSPPNTWSDGFPLACLSVCLPVSVEFLMKHWPHVAQYRNCRTFLIPSSDLVSSQWLASPLCCWASAFRGKPKGCKEATTLQSRVPTSFQWELIQFSAVKKNKKPMFQERWLSVLVSNSSCASPKSSKTIPVHTTEPV